MASQALKEPEFVLPYSKTHFWKRQEVMVDNNHWKSKNEIPLGSINPFRVYHEDIPDADIVTAPLPNPKLNVQQINPLNILISARTGIGKTRLSKRILYYLKNNNYNILVFEPKSYEFLNAKNKGEGKRLHHLEKNDNMPVVSYVPSYCRNYLEKKGFDVDNMNFFRLDLEEFNYSEFWECLGFTSKASQFIASQIHQGNTDLDSIQEQVVKMYSYSYMMRQAIENTFANLKNLGFFDEKYPILDLAGEWAKGNVVVINFYRQKGAFMNTIIAKISELCAIIGQNEATHGLDKVTKKMILYDDAPFYAKQEGFSTKNMAIDAIVESQNMNRTLGVNTIVVTQSPNLIDDEIYETPDIKLISYNDNYAPYLGRIPYNAYLWITGRTEEGGDGLYCDEDDYVFEWLYCVGKTKWLTFFPFDVLVGH